MNLKKYLILPICLFLISCSQPKNDAPGVAESFVKNYYKFMNQEEAIKYTSMVAKDKMSKELTLVREARAKNPQALDANRAKVGYHLDETKIENDMAFITFTLSIAPNGSQPFDRTALITLKKEQADWKVIDYEETSSTQK